MIRTRGDVKLFNFLRNTKRHRMFWARPIKCNVFLFTFDQKGKTAALVVAVKLQRLFMLIKVNIERTKLLSVQQPGANVFCLG